MTGQVALMLGVVACAAVLAAGEEGSFAKGANEEICRQFHQDPCRHPVIAVPISFPRPKVTPAAASPRRSCRPPDRQTGMPVNSVIAAPMPKRASPLTAPLDRTAVLPRVTRNGRIGTMAPTVKSRN